MPKASIPGTMNLHHKACILALALGAAPSVQADFEGPGSDPFFDALAKQEKDFSLWFRAYLGYNDNVQFVPDAAVIAADQESFYLGLSAAGSYRFMENGNWSAEAALRVDQTFHFEGSGGAIAPDNFDFTVVHPSLALNYADGDWYGRASYGFRWEDASTPSIGLDAHIVGFMVGRKWGECLHSELAWTHGWEDYHNASTAARDGERDRFSLSLISPAANSMPRMILRYTYTDNDADSRFFSYSGHELLFRSEHGLTERLGMALQFSYEDRDYASGGGARSSQEIFKAGIQFIYAIDENWTADFYYNYLDVDSNALFFRGERNDVGIGIRYDF